MSIAGVSPFAGATDGTAGAVRSVPALDSSAFLRLMTAQMQAQDPFKPMDQTAMLGQLAQFSQVSGVTEMNATLARLSTQLADQTQILDAIRTQLSMPITASSTPSSVPPQE